MTGGRVIRPGTRPLLKQATKKHKRPCASAPAVPGSVALSFHTRRTLGPAPQWRAKATWAAVTADVAGRPINVESYQVQLRATDASGDPVETGLQDQALTATGADFTVHAGTAPVNKLARELNASPDEIKKTLTGLTTGIATQVEFLAREDVGGSAPTLKFEIWNVTDSTSVASRNFLISGVNPKLYVRLSLTPVVGKTYEARCSWVSGSGIGLLDHIQWHALGNAAVWRRDVASDESPLDANFPDIPRPRSWYFQTRVRALNRIHGARCWSAWSAWTTATNPASLATVGPPAPTGLVLVLDKVEGSRPRPWRAKLQWNEIPWWVPPDDDPVLGAASYHVQLAASNNGGTTTANVRRKTVEADDSDGNQTANAQFLANIRGKRHYRGRVKAVDEQGRRGAWSAWTAWASPGGEPAPPINVTWSNPNAATLVATWDDPTDPTDVDRYRVRVIKGASTVMEDRYTVSNKWIYHIPLADRGSQHKVRVTSVEGETLLDVDEVAPTGWDTPQVSTDVDSSLVDNTAHTSGSYVNVPTAALGATTVTHWEMDSNVANQLTSYIATMDNPGWIVMDANLVDIVAPYDAGQLTGQIQLISAASGSNQIYLGAATGDIFIDAADTRLVGHEMRGFCAVRAYNDNASARNFGHGVMYGGVARGSNVPSSVTFTTAGTDLNTSSPTATDITLRGFLFEVSVNATSAGRMSRSFVTVGN